MSAPSSKGVCSDGEQKQLSTASRSNCRRRAEAIVDGQHGADVPTDLGQCRYICHGIERIRRSLDEEHSGIRLGRLAPLIGISEGNKTRLDAELLQRVLEQAHRGAKDIA